MTRRPPEESVRAYISIPQDAKWRGKARLITKGNNRLGLPHFFRRLGLGSAQRAFAEQDPKKCTKRDIPADVHPADEGPVLERKGEEKGGCARKSRSKDKQGGRREAKVKTSKECVYACGGL
ncbi:hypothetical protein MRX96_001352 [Rhipicephalus microplus]